MKFCRIVIGIGPRDTAALATQLPDDEPRRISTATQTEEQICDCTANVIGYLSRRPTVV